MDTTTAYSWVPYYEKLADALLPYADKRLELLNKLIKEFERHKVIAPTWSKSKRIEDVTDIDPFSVFGGFNRYLTKTNRLQYVKALATSLDIENPDFTDFLGVPVLNNMNANFAPYECEHNEIQNLWNLFKAALRYADEQNPDREHEFIKWFDIVENQPRIIWNITMGLYWIRPTFFINLDDLNRTYLAVTNGIKEHLPDFEQKLTGRAYCELCRHCREWAGQNTDKPRTLPEISACAYDFWDKRKGSNQYWVMACKDSQGKDHWQECFENGRMIIGYGLVGDITQFFEKGANKNEGKTRELESIADALNAKYDDKTYSKSSHWPNWLRTFAKEIKLNDIIVAKSGTGYVKGFGVVTEEYSYTETPLVDDFNHELGVQWTQISEVDLGKDFFGRMQTLSLLTGLKAVQIDELWQKNTPKESMETPSSQQSVIASAPPQKEENEQYTKEDFLREVFMTEEKYAQTVAALKYKYNIILQGPPGVGKSYAAKRLAYSLMGERDDERICMIQFHHSYSYEDFMQGYRPDKDGKFTLRNGKFYNFCKKAESSDKEYYLIIDEINRGDLNKIFGEAFLLMEKDKRNTDSVQLAYSSEQETFTIPDNIRIIGMMNTADRSIALIDHALRRRFAFIELEPAFGMAAFQSFVQDAPSAEKLQKLLAVIANLNTKIAEDSSLGRGYRIGHSYFCPSNPAELTNERLNAIVEFELIPLLEEYWFDEPDEVTDWSLKLRNALK